MKRIAFANDLRGIAALLVVISHFYAKFWLQPRIVSELLGIATFTPSSIPFITHIFQNFFGSYFSHVGVALFFLISGFVIPFSLEKYSLQQFIRQRFFRIFPMYWMSLVYTLGVMSIFYIFIHKTIPFTIPHIAAQALLVRDIFLFPSIDAISWTLEIEIRFYMFALILFYSFRYKKHFLIVTIYTLAIFLSLFGRNIINHFFNNEILLQQLLYFFQLDTLIITFMLFGWISHLFYTGKIKKRFFVLLIIANLVFFLVQKQVTGLFSPSILDVFTVSYIVSLAIFLYLMILTMYKTYKSHKVLNFFANISYPLYATHAIIGYLFIYLLLNMGIPQHLVLFIVTVYVIFIAFIFHVFIELPSMRKAKA